MQRILIKAFKLFCKIIGKNRPTNFLGSNYGGWHFLKPEDGQSLNIISAGVGEDISFDIEFLNSFDCKVVLIDPTPRSIMHVENVIKSLGRMKTKEYDQKSGKQLIESYDLSHIKVNDLVFIRKAIYNKTNEAVKFYLPKNQNHVSHSISNFQNNFSRNTDYIEVQSITLDEVMKEVAFKKIDLLKLDIEGAENHVIPDMLDKRIFPEQILVEFDELRTNKIKPLAYAFRIFIRLIFNNYELIKTNNFPNFLFVNNKV